MKYELVDWQKSPIIGAVSAEDIKEGASRRGPASKEKDWGTGGNSKESTIGMRDAIARTGISDDKNIRPRGKGREVGKEVNHCAYSADDQIDVTHWNAVYNLNYIIFICAKMFEWTDVTAAATAKQRGGGDREVVGDRTDVGVRAIGRRRVRGVREK